LAPLGTTLKKSLNFYIAYKKLEVNIGWFREFQVSKLIGSKIEVGGLYECTVYYIATHFPHEAEKAPELESIINL
jgi:hypothetical protein